MNVYKSHSIAYTICGNTRNLAFGFYMMMKLMKDDELDNVQFHICKIYINLTG